MTLRLLGLGALLCSACAAPSIIEVAAPLTVVDSFPGNGSRLPGSDVRHLEVVFSANIDPAQAWPLVRLESVDGDDVVDQRYTLVPNAAAGEQGYSTEQFTLSATLGAPSTDGTLPDGALFRLLIGKGVTGVAGEVLPVDVVHRFATGS